MKESVVKQTMVKILYGLRSEISIFECFIVSLCFLTLYGFILRNNVTHVET